MKNRFTAGVIPIRIGEPFTLRELAGPWSWVANRYYWFAFDELMAPHYRQIVRLGVDPVSSLMEPASTQLAGNVELMLEKTQLAFKISSASRGSVVLKVLGVWKALKTLASWLPVYGVWLQNKGRIDIHTEIERSAALIEVTKNFESFGIQSEIARRMALHRLYSSWPDFYAEASRGVEASISFEPPRRKRQILEVSDAEVNTLIAPIPGIPQLEKVLEVKKSPQKRLPKQ